MLALKLQKASFLKFLEDANDILVECYQFFSAKIHPKANASDSKTFYPKWKPKKASFEKSPNFLSEKVCAEKGALISQNAFFKAKAFMKVKGYFDHTKCFEETSQRAEKDRKYFPQLFQQNSHPHNGIKKPHKTTKKKQKILAYFLYFASSGLRKSGQIRANGEKN